MRSLKRKRSNPLDDNFTRGERAILTTLIYGDVFHFPLTKDELWQYLITDTKIKKKDFEVALNGLSTHILSQDGYVTLPNKTANISKRKKNLDEVQKKMSIAEEVSSVLFAIPSIRLLGISGGLAARNVMPKDDIDLFIITEKGKVFTTRFWVLIYLTFMRKRRKRGDTKTQNMFCINLIIDETETAWPIEKRDVYTAHEIAQMKPLYERDNMYASFIKSNNWVKAYLPNGTSDSMILPKSKTNAMFIKVLSRLIFFLSSERALRLLQIFIMKNHRTNETVTNTHLAFHPRDYRAETLKQLKLKMRQLGLLTNL